MPSTQTAMRLRAYSLSSEGAMVSEREWAVWETSIAQRASAVGGGGYQWRLGGERSWSKR